MISAYPLRTLAEISENHDARRVPVKAADRKPGPYPYYGAQGIVDYVDDYLLDGVFLLVAEDGENLRSRIEDIAFLATGKFWVNNHAHILRANSDAATHFLRYAINFSDVSGYITGSTIPKLSQRSLRSILIPCPPPAVQEEIVSLLGALDNKIDLNRRMNETLEAMARAIFKDWFVDFGPTRAKAEGRTPYLAPELWDLFPDALDDEDKPVGWTYSEIGKEVHVVGGGTPSTKEPSYWDGGEHHWATPKDLSKPTSPVLLGTDRKVTDAGVHKISSGLLPVGTVLLSSRAPIGYLAITEVPTAINQGFIAMNCRKRLPNTFVLFWCHENLDYIKDISGGSTFAEISKRAFRPVPVVVPSEQVLEAYDRLIRPLYARIVANTKENETLAQTRDLLLPKLMSGELRLRDTERAQEAVA